MYRKWIVTLGGVGLVPGMPGTYASVIAAAAFYALCRTIHFFVYPLIIGMALIAAAVSIWLYPWTEKHFKRRDPSQFVLDELVGQWTTLLLLPILETLHSPVTTEGDSAASPSVAYIIAGLFLFRAFDVAKPFPIRDVERLPGAAGLLLDDVVAGIYAFLSLCVIVLVLHALLGPNLFTPVTWSV